MAKYLRKMCNLESLKCKYFQNIDDFHRWAQPTKVKALATWIVEPLQTLPPYWFVKPQYIDETRKNGRMADAVPYLDFVEGLQLDYRWWYSMPWVRCAFVTFSKHKGSSQLKSPSMDIFEWLLINILLNLTFEIHWRQIWNDGTKFHNFHFDF